MSLYDVNPDNASSFDFRLSDGTAVDFVKVTSKDNIQVRLPDDPVDPLRIFRRDGSHSRDELDVTLIATTTPSAEAGTLFPFDSVIVRGGVAYGLTPLGRVNA